MTKHNAPALRFDGFEGEWKTNQVGRIAARAIGGGTPSRAVSDYWNGSIPWIQSSDVKERSIFGCTPKHFISSRGLASSATSLVKGGSIAIVTRVGVGKVAVMAEDYCSSQDFLNLSDVQGDLTFLGVLLKHELEGISSQTQGTSIKGVTKENVLSLNIHVPTSEEQRAIGELFADLDALIEQHRAKHANLQQTKTALLQRMFPQDGADEPELRLGGFSGAWEPRIMRDCAEYSKGSGYSKKDIADEGTPVIHYGRLYTNYETAITDVDTFASPEPDALISRGDEVLVPASGETAEDIAIASALLQSGVLIGGDLNVIRPRRNIDPVFLALSLSNGVAKENLVKRAQGKSVVHLRNSDIQDVEIFFPPLEEQRAIGEVFTNLDALIAAEHRYITQLTQAKTALLQRMFV